MRAVDYVDLGHYLKDVRESLHITVEEAALALHIRPKYLQDLEKGDLSNLPGKPYIRGYIKNYTEYLRLDPQEVLEQYEALLDNGVPQFFIPKTGIRENAPSAGILWLCAMSLIGLYGCWYFALYDETAVQNVVDEFSLEYNQVKIPEAWAGCLNSGNVMCFMELQQKTIIPDIPETQLLPPPPDVKAPSGNQPGVSPEKE